MISPVLAASVFPPSFSSCLLPSSPKPNYPHVSHLHLICPSPSHEFKLLLIPSCARLRFVKVSSLTPHPTPPHPPFFTIAWNIDLIRCLCWIGKLAGLNCLYKLFSEISKLSHWFSCIPHYSLTASDRHFMIGLLRSRTL